MVDEERLVSGPKQTLSHIGKAVEKPDLCIADDAEGRQSRLADPTIPRFWPQSPREMSRRRVSAVGEQHSLVVATGKEGGIQS